MLKDNIYNWIKNVNEKGSNPSFDNIMEKFIDDYEVKEIEDALDQLEIENQISKTDLCGIIFYEAW